MRLFGWTLLSAMIFGGCVNSGPPLSGSSNGQLVEGYGVHQASKDIMLKGKTRGPNDMNYAGLPLKDLTLYEMSKEAGVKLVYVSVVAEWCGPCNAEQQDVPDIQKEFEPQGVKIVEVLFQDNDHMPAQEQNLNTWGDRYDLHVTMTLDVNNDQIPHYSPTTDVNLPINMLILPDTHEIVHKYVGMEPDLAGLLKDTLHGL